MKTENQEKLSLGIGNEEFQQLKPAKVFVKEVEVRNVDVNGKVCEKVFCRCKHPDQEGLIEISGAKYIKNDKVECSGLWFKIDGKGLILKGSCLACFLVFFKCENLERLKNKEIETAIDSKGYLCFKAY